MATYTTNYNLKKPATDDPVLISDINGDMDTIDTQMKVNADAITTKQNIVTGAATTITDANLTPSKVLVSTAGGKVAVSAITPTELSRLSGVSSNVQTQINAEASGRASADATLQNNINAEASARSSADTTLQNNINAEASTRQDTDIQLNNNIVAEASARASADASLQASVNIKEAKWIDVSDIAVSNWVTSTYTTQKGIKQYPYMAVINVTGVTARTMCMVEFADEQAYSGNYCNSCISEAGTVTIFSKLNTPITLNRIIGKV